MLPTFLPPTCLDLPPGHAAGQLPPLRPDDARARELLRALCEQVSADGAQVLILFWPDGLWTLLAIDPPAGAAVADALELVPVLLACPEEMATIRQRAAEGRRLVHLVMRQPHAPLH
ncbi:hypothetical protein E5198_11940 [Pseudomonas sp. A-1]|uniref:hypothetical protein n=1 Tax=Pseudomonas sp. A-1 TaxID=1821274 RepID=UPI0010A677DF|nr:hypothetical protein [Pseudomonas sp. A-1]THG81550.1 hypothetical protein E5198_11940 [Pseudomonas sp. A-1]